MKIAQKVNSIYLRSSWHKQVDILLLIFDFKDILGLLESFPF